MATSRSNMRELLSIMATVQGDLSSLTAPPFVLATNSTVEIPQYWADHQSLFVGQATETNSEKRSLAVLKSFLCALKNQQYAGRPEKEGIKKPINAFLGELFIGSWKDDKLGETRLVSEQVSHHPPVTACYMWNDKHGIRSGGFTEQEITFNGNVNIKQKGYVTLHMDKHNEDYLIPVPNIKVKGLLGGAPYPELEGDYSLIGSSGYVSRIKFAGRGFFGSGQKNAFEASLYHTDRPKEVLYTAKGAWNSGFSIQDANGKDIETIKIDDLTRTNIKVDDLVRQDPWESRKAWADVISAIRSNNMRGVTEAKSRIENGQRRMRVEEDARREPWKTLFFQRVEHDLVFEKLSPHDRASFSVDPAGDIWKIDLQAIKNMKKPFHGDLLPTNERVGKPSTQTETRQPPQKHALPAPATAAAQVALREESAGYVQRMSVDQGRPTKDLESRHRRFSAPPVKEPSDAQVESFLRARFSNLKFE
jgi:hypothetical protein